ncbi:hypothetical protein I4U23_013895 [Adineta vaga]|nr:hypothetical protein I4U23_013895 [Adineta vaga]
MRASLVICLALFVVMVSCAVPKTSKAPKRQSAYAYLRSVRGKNSCAGGTCPFWERHGRSFAALRCYSQQYQECVCLHRMCFSSCMFQRDECNKEMAICLKQICPRCMPASSLSMCQVYDSMADKVAQALSVFACYPCCPNLVNSASNNTNNTGANIITTTPQSANGVNTGATGNTNGAAAGSTTPIPQNTNNTSINGGMGPNTVNGARPNNNNGNTSNFGGVFPGSGVANLNANIRNNSSNNSNANKNRPVQNQQVRQVTRPTTRRTVTTRRTTTRRKTTTTRRPLTTTTTARGNNIKNAVRKPVQAQKKPQF